MLTDNEKKEILEEAKAFPYKKAAVIDALKIVQNHKGWLSDESIRDIAEFLEMSVDEVDSIATFYSRLYRQPVGRNVILICDGITCMIMDYESIYDYISNKLGIKFGETTSDNRYTLLPISCLGDCDNAPSMMINNDLYNRLTIENIDDLLDGYK
ncbi:MAG TPA: NADH-quinone oxidoreductase subunit NuoE [Lentimicrobium sp.]|nr:NADH-quinone oxidoreductase subunit NuoE [Lentimicrobium sp.]